MITTMNIYYKKLLSLLSPERIDKDIIEVRQIDNLSLFDFSKILNYCNTSVMSNLSKMLQFVDSGNREIVNPSILNNIEKIYFSSLSIDGSTGKELDSNIILKSKRDRNCRIYLVDCDSFDGNVDNYSYRLFEFTVFSPVTGKDENILDIFVNRHIIDSESNTIDLISDIAQYTINRAIYNLTKYVPNKLPYDRDNPVGNIVLSNDISVTDTVFVIEYLKAYITILSRYFQLDIDTIIEANPLYIDQYEYGANNSEEFIKSVYNLWKDPDSYNFQMALDILYSLLKKACR